MKGMIRTAAALVLLAACTTSVFDLAVGDCLIDPGEGSIDTIDVVDCAEDHAYEVYANLIVPESVGLDGATDFATDGCYEAFASYVGAEFEASIYDFTWLEPTLDSWEQRDDRTVNCLLYDFQAGSSVGSAQGSGA